MSTEDAAPFLPWWTAHHPGTWPVGWSLRARAHRQWLRIHSLPEGRPHPENEDDWTELLARHREVSVTTLGDHAACWLILGGDEHRLRYEGLALSPIAADQLPPSTDGVVRHFAVTKVEWNFDAFEPLIRELADEDDGRSLLVTNFDTGDVYAPYPGGADLFFHRFREHDEAVHRFGDWRSKRSDGL